MILTVPRSWELGDCGAAGSKPVMEEMLFKKFADIDVFDIEANTRDAEEMIRVVAGIAPTFGGINLEKISGRLGNVLAIERRLQAMLDIPVFTTISMDSYVIPAAGLVNALELVGKRMDEVKVVFGRWRGRGCLRQSLAENRYPAGKYLDARPLRAGPPGAQGGNVRGEGRFARAEGPASLSECLEGGDVFIGLSAGNIVSEEMLARMRRDPMIFACATCINPYVYSANGAAG